MPYIKPEDRKAIADKVWVLGGEIKLFEDESKYPGLMNYAISKLIKEVYGTNCNYRTYNEIIGILESCKLEFYRAQVAHYEDLKRMENGEV